MLIFDKEERVKFISLSSGSNGNCYYLSNGTVSIIIDFGIGVRTAKKRLTGYGIDINEIDLVLVTHDHIDHIKHLGSFAERYMKPVYATESLHRALSDHFVTRGKIGAFKKIIEAEIPCEYKSVKITPFPVPHDGTDNYGFHIEMSGVKITLVTDVGAVTDTVLKYASMANHLVFESNYDCDMLQCGSYPKMLIERISNGKGHLSNKQSAEAIGKIYHRDMKSLLLCHLSANNNNPEIAYSTASQSLISAGAIPGENITLECLPRGASSRMYIFD